MQAIPSSKPRPPTCSDLIGQLTLQAVKVLHCPFPCLASFFHLYTSCSFLVARLCASFFLLLVVMMLSQNIINARFKHVQAIPTFRLLSAEYAFPVNSAKKLSTPYLIEKLSA